MDTHTFLWFLMESDRLSDKVLQTIQDADNALYISAVSIWELSLKYAIGKLQLKGTDPRAMLAAARENGILELALTHEDCASYHLLPAKDEHKDPFDRMLIWQAISRRMPILSKDNSFQQYRPDGLELIW
jgi:PIN domain nuclease of toxin-antitoxin system